MRGEVLVDKVRKIKTDFGASLPRESRKSGKLNKFGGAAAIQILREALGDEGIVTSQRDVFMRGVKAEVDLIVPHAGQKPFLDLLYEPNQVVAALEVKKSGIYREKALEKTRNDFARLKEAGIPCAYVTFEERRNFQRRATCENLGVPCFTLAWHKKADGPLEPTQDWEGLVKFLREAVDV